MIDFDKASLHIFWSVGYGKFGLAAGQVQVPYEAGESTADFLMGKAGEGRTSSEGPSAGGASIPLTLESKEFDLLHMPSKWNPRDTHSGRLVVTHNRVQWMDRSDRFATPCNDSAIEKTKVWTFFSLVLPHKTYNFYAEDEDTPKQVKGSTRHSTFIYDQIRQAIAARCSLNR